MSDPPLGQDQLTPTQRIGVQLFDELEQRIPRAEVTEVVALVSGICQQVAPGCFVEARGSYCRGKKVGD